MRIRVLLLLSMLIGGTAAFALIDCHDEPNLARRAQSAALILVGSIDRIDDPNNMIPENKPELGRFVCGNVRVIFRVQQALKGTFKPEVTFECPACFLELNGCKNSPELKVRETAVVFLSTLGPSLSIEGGAYALVYPNERELSDLKKEVAKSLAKGP